jgi:hypothetical protein
MNIKPELNINKQTSFNSDSSTTSSNNINLINTLEDQINTEIGYNYIKKKISSYFWSQISTPINCIIALLTAISTTKVNYNNFLSDKIYLHINIATLIITTLNTFINPSQYSNYNLESMKKWMEFGGDFEHTYYNNYLTDNIISDTEKINNYNYLLTKIDNYKLNEINSKNINIVSDCIYYIYFKCYNKEKWFDINHIILNDNYIKNTNKELKKRKKQLFVLEKKIELINETMSNNNISNKENNNIINFCDTVTNDFINKKCSIHSNTKNINNSIKIVPGHVYINSSENIDFI